MTTDTPLITGTDFITVGTRDFEAAVEFYGTTLGLPESGRWGQMPAAEFETGNLTIAVMESQGFGIEFRPTSHPIELRVDDVESARATLESRGVAFKERRWTPASAIRRSSRIRTATSWRSTTATRHASELMPAFAAGAPGLGCLACSCTSVRRKPGTIRRWSSPSAGRSCPRS